jgi:2,3-bisphosphoglycerate-independent phosphoglycerate mutase
LTNAHFVFRATVAHRGVFLIKASGLSKNISNVDPAYSKKNGLSNAEEKFEMIVPECVALAKGAEKSAALVNEFVEKSHLVLQESKVNEKRLAKGLLPANVILLRDAETHLKKPPVKFKNWAILADMPLEVGIGKLLRMKIVPVETPTFTARDYPARVKQTLATLKKFDCVYVHLKGPDLFGHDGDAIGKTKCIEDIDRVYFGPLLKKLDLKKTRVLVTSDHTTACVKAAHTSDSVPFIITTNEKTGGKYDETHCRKKKPIKASELMPMLLI